MNYTWHLADAAMVFPTMFGVVSAGGQTKTAAANSSMFEVASARPAVPGGSYEIRGGPGTADPGRILGQPQASPAFEVTSVKPNTLRYPEITHPEMACSGGRFSARWQAPRTLIRWAYRFERYELLGLPAWADGTGDRYDIEGRASAPMTEDQSRLMVQTLFADRFKLKVHWESQETLVYALVVGKGGPKMQMVTESDPANSVHFVLAGSPTQMFDRKLKGWTMDQPALALSVAGLEREVVDKTGIEGVYKFDLEFRPESMPVERGTDVRTALEKLGLKLEARKETVKRLVVDHIEKPDEN